jgi:predicted RNA-binding Zn ribbon-like protein
MLVIGGTPLSSQEFPDQDPHPHPKPDAPGDLELIRLLVNTLDVETGKDTLATATALKAWLLEQKLVPRSIDVDDDDVARTAGFREALRQLMWANGDGTVDNSALAVLNDVARNGRMVVRFTTDASPSLASEAQGVDAVLAGMVGIVFTATTDGSWSRMKACTSDTCRWAFYDHSKNHSRQWCDMAVCGNRNKVRTFRTKRQTPAKA